MDVQRELRRISVQLQGLHELLEAMNLGARASTSSQLTLAGVMDELAERTAVQVGDPGDLELVETRLHGLVPATGGAGAIIAGLMRDGATTRWHKTGVWHTPDQVPTGQLLRFLAPLGHPHRVELLKRLAAGVSTTGQLQDATGTSGGQFYHHLSRLADAGYLSRLAEGRYTLSSRGKVALTCLSVLCSLLSEWPEELGERQACERLPSDRSEHPPDEQAEPPP
jgi:DNA-binding transcriptional ArsR family regulator